MQKHRLTTLPQLTRLLKKKSRTLALSAEQQQSLNRTKLNALVRSQFSAPEENLDPADFPGGAMLLGAESAYAYLPGDPLTALGAALVRSGERAMHVAVDDDAGLVAAAAAGFDPAPTVWSIAGTTLVPADPSAATAETEIPLGDVNVAIMQEHGLEVVAEHGAIIGEVLGLEVARLGVFLQTGEPRLQVGVGAFDQEAFATINPHTSPTEGLINVISEVKQYRRAGAPPHPINRLVRERWVRSILLQDPQSIGLRRLSPVASARARSGLRDTMPALALGTDDDGQVVLVVCLTGVNFGGVSIAAEAASRLAADRVIVVVPPRDQYPQLRELVGRFRWPSVVIDAPVPWESAGNSDH